MFGYLNTHSVYFQACAFLLENLSFSNYASLQSSEHSNTISSPIDLQFTLSTHISVSSSTSTNSIPSPTPITTTSPLSSHQPQSMQSQPTATNIHPMLTRSKNGIHKPKAYTATKTSFAPYLLSLFPLLVFKLLSMNVGEKLCKVNSMHYSLLVHGLWFHHPYLITLLDVNGSLGLKGTLWYIRKV